jgi:hypothetical protein
MNGMSADRLWHYLYAIGFAFVLMLVFYWTGLIGIFSTGFGIALVILLFIVIYEHIAKGWFRGIVFSFLTIWLVHVFVWPFVFDQLPPSTQDSLESRGMDANTRLNIWFESPGAKARSLRLVHCKVMEKQLVKVEIQSRLDQLKALADVGNTMAQAEITRIHNTAGRSPTMADFIVLQERIAATKRSYGLGVGDPTILGIYEEMAAATKEIVSYGQKCRLGIDGLPSASIPTKEDLPSTTASWLTTILAFGLVGLGLVYAGKHSLVWKPGLATLIGIAGIIIAILLAVQWASTWEWKLPWSGGSSGPASTDTRTTFSTPKVATGKKRYTIPAHGGAPMCFLQYKGWGAWPEVFDYPRDFNRLVQVGLVTDPNGYSYFKDGLPCYISKDEAFDMLIEFDPNRR